MSAVNYESKISAAHLERKAYIYIRQSTMQQVRENVISGQRQYDLRQRALDLGWRENQVIVIDQDQGRSGTTIDGRDGFNSLLADVASKKVGGIFGLEVARLARDSSDWYLLIKLCNYTDTLVIDGHTVFDPRDENDRLCLGIKGTFAELELSVMKDRLAGARLKKARAGKLRAVLPIGFVFDAQKNVVLDPDENVQNAIRYVLGSFDRFSSLHAAVRHFNEQKFLFPSRPSYGPDKGVLRWSPLKYTRAKYVLDCPTYAGTYVYGRSKSQTSLSFDRGITRVHRHSVRVPREDWKIVIHGMHEGYITWEKFLHNKQRLADNQFVAADSARGAVRAGSALLQGIAVCGRCGRKMKVKYRSFPKHPYYVCQGDGDLVPNGHCLAVATRPLDALVTDLLFQAFRPAQLQVSIEALKQIGAQERELERQWKLHLDKAEYEADLAYRQFNLVDPLNRNVTSQLERIWNERLVEVERLKIEWDEVRNSIPPPLSPAEQRAVMSLAGDIPSVWRAATTTNDERKQLLRLMIKDVTLLKEASGIRHSVKAGMRWHGGHYSELYFCPVIRIGRPRPEPGLIIEIRRLAERFTDAEIAGRLNERGFRSARGLEFNRRIVNSLRRRVNIPGVPTLSIKDGRDAEGRYTLIAAAGVLNVRVETVRRWIIKGVLKAVKPPPRNSWRVYITPEVLGLKRLKK